MKAGQARMQMSIHANATAAHERVQGGSTAQNPVTTPGESSEGMGLPAPLVNDRHKPRGSPPAALQQYVSSCLP